MILLITLIGKQLVNSIIEILATKILNFLNYIYYHRNELDRNNGILNIILGKYITLCLMLIT